MEIKGLTTIVIAEDEDYNFILLNEMLSTPNLTILHASNGFEAVEFCKSKQQIDLVLMDIKMPIMNGYEATSQIKEIRPNMPIIVQTSYSSDADREKAFASGCSDFIDKPINRNMLISKINKLLNN
ncbi:MAG: response regulator [Bacteroidales bacterium]|nr:MAG: response regulator [Bacteroidales bacterium]